MCLSFANVSDEANPNIQDAFGASLRDAEPALQGGSRADEAEEEMGLPPTQRLSQVCEILGLAVCIEDFDDSRFANTAFSTEHVSRGYPSDALSSNASIHNYPASCTSRSNPCNFSIHLSLRKRDDIVSAGDIPLIVLV